MIKISKIKKLYCDFPQWFQLVLQSLAYIGLALTGLFVYGYLQIGLSLSLRAIYLLTQNIIVSALIGIIVLAIIYIVVLKLLWPKNYKNQLTTLTSCKYWLINIGLLIIVKLSQILIVSISKTHSNTTNQEIINYIFYSSRLNQIYIILMTIFLAPLIEEVLFRWIPFHLIKNQGLALLIGSIAFTLCHSPNNCIAIILYLIMGIALGVDYYWNGYKGSYILHFLINLTAILTMLKF